MKKLTKVLIVFALLLAALWMFALYYFSSGSLEPDNAVWESYLGKDTDTGILPDIYANYFTYTFVRTNKNMGFQIKGKFPDTRYFSFNVYSLDDNATQGSIIDYQIQTDSGDPNPFIAGKSEAKTDDNFTVHLVPSKHNDGQLNNTLAFRDDARLMTMVIRLYDYHVDDFGGVEFPTVEAFEIEEDGKVIPVKKPRALNLRFLVETFSLPKMVERLSVVFKTENHYKVKAPHSDNAYYALPFHAIDDSGYIENNDNRYLLCAITKKDNEVYVFKFKAPTYTTGPENINNTDMRYWSFNLGDSETFNFNGTMDKEFLQDESGYVTLILGDKDIQVEQRVKDLGFNFMEWNMPSNKALIHFRHMLADPSFEAQIDNVSPLTESTTDFQSIEARHVMGDYTPTGLRMSKAGFLMEYK